MNSKILYGIIAVMFIGMCAMGFVIYQQQNYIESIHSEVVSNSVDIYALQNQEQPEDSSMDIAKLYLAVSSLRSEIERIEADVSYSSNQQYTMTGVSMYDLEYKINNLERQVSEIKSKLGIYY